MDEKRAALLLGTLERRTRPAEVEIRADGESGDFTVRGYASVVEHPYEVYGGPDRGGWIETIARDAFGVTLAAKPDVAFLINHDGIPLARTRSGTLSLAADNTGLSSEASVDGQSPLGATLRSAMKRGDLDQMSFGFRVTRQEWNDDYTERRITEVSLDHGDVSIVTYPANPATSMNIVSARSAVNFLRTSELAEIRADVTPEELAEAHVRLGELVAKLDERACVEVHVSTDDDAEDLADGGADEATEGEPSLSSLVDLAVALLTQAASGLSQLSATDEGKEQADAVVRRFAQVLSGAASTPVVVPVELDVAVGEPEAEERTEEPVEETEFRTGMSLDHARAVLQLDAA